LILPILITTASEGWNPDKKRASLYAAGSFVQKQTQEDMPPLPSFLRDRQAVPAY